MIRPQLEYAETVRSPYKKRHINKLERMQRMTTKLVPELEGLQYQDRLREINLTTLEQRRDRGDLIKTYVFKRIEETDNNNMILREEGNTRHIRDHSKKTEKRKIFKKYKEV